MSNQFRIDKSNFTAEQLAQWEELLQIGKAEVDPEAAKKEMEDDDLPPAPKKKTEKAEVEDMEETKKSAEVEVPQFVKDAIAKSEEFMVRIEKQEMAEVAKKYAILGEKPEELAEKLYNLKKSSPEMYDTCISMLDSQVQMIEKSGLFTEIGKSGASGNAGPVGAEAKIQAKADEIQKADSTISRSDAIAKAWMENPDLMAEYDAEYQK